MNDKRVDADGVPGRESQRVRGKVGGPALSHLSHLVFSKNLCTFIQSRRISFLQRRGEEQWGSGEHLPHHRKQLRYTAKKPQGDSNGREHPPHALCALSCLVSAKEGGTPAALPRTSTSSCILPARAQISRTSPHSPSTGPSLAS